MADFVSRVARSWRLIKASTAVLQDDGELLLLPVLSGAASLIVGGAFVWQAMNGHAFDPVKHGQTALSASLYVWLFAFYLVQYFIIIFFNTALVGAALDRLAGRNPTIGSALRLAASRIGPIFGYAILSATVGLLLRFIGEKLGIIGRLIEAGAGLAWTVTTFLVVPVLAAEGVGPIKAVERSVGLLKKSWGENIVGNVGISMIMGFFIGLAALGFVLSVQLLLPVSPAAAWALMTASALAFIALLVFSAALSAVYSAAVYSYAVTGEPPIDFDRDMVRGAFGPKKSR